MLEGNPWFILRDVLIALGYNLGPRTQTPNVSVAARKLASDEAQLYRIQVKVVSRSGAREVMLISESGLNKLVMRPDKPEAKKFQDWVTREVLPSIRKTGTYTMPGGVGPIEGDTSVLTRLNEDPPPDDLQLNRKQLKVTPRWAPSGAPC
ncbi:BRO family protein [Cereibacter sphaeroides]|jgi:Prophage antirepressor|uniref:BRO-N domain-containing protein n=1 Tax=Cereibacter sphaeroides TaxID=1063 RepID=UPI0009B6F384|nr:BRO family protein [Cereibacter sphaeroides]GEM94689.1 hypothetical protein RSP03_37560 [Cereibacter sphaeroides]